MSFSYVFLAIKMGIGCVIGSYLDHLLTRFKIQICIFATELACILVYNVNPNQKYWVILKMYKTIHLHYGLMSGLTARQRLPSMTLPDLQVHFSLSGFGTVWEWNSKPW